MENNKRGVMNFTQNIKPLMMKCRKGEKITKDEQRQIVEYYLEVVHYLGLTKKQVVGGGYHRPVCVKCRCELCPETNGMGVVDTFRPSDSDKDELYELWDADKWKCPSCGMEVIGGFGEGCISAHYRDDFKQMIDGYMRRAKLIINKG